MKMGSRKGEGGRENHRVLAACFTFRRAMRVAPNERDTNNCFEV